MVSVWLRQACCFWSDSSWVTAKLRKSWLIRGRLKVLPVASAHDGHPDIYDRTECPSLGQDCILSCE